MNGTLVTAAPAWQFTDARGQEPFRAELLGLERLENHARALAREGQHATLTEGAPLLRHFGQIRRALSGAHARLSEWTKSGQRPDGEAEWLLDNHHIVADVLREIQTDMPVDYYRLLPKLGFGPLAGFPRVYSLALNLIAHSDSSLDETHMSRFVQAYQDVTPLTIGELWAVPTMLRLVLVDNLRRLAEKTVEAHADRDRAQQCAADILASQESGECRVKLSQLFSQSSGGSDAFVIRVHEELRDHGAAAEEEWLEKFVAAGGTPMAGVLAREQRLRAANQVSIGNCVASLRLLSALDWTAFFERVSIVEAILRRDPAGIYEKQDVSTRDRYRRVVEKMARGSKLGEPEIAERARSIAAARHAEEAHGNELGNGQASRALHDIQPDEHVGYYLVGEGRTQFESAIGYRPCLGDRWQNFLRTHPQSSYFGGVGLLTLALLSAIVFWIAHAHVLSTMLLLLLAAIWLVPASELALGLIHGLVTHSLFPRVLPKLFFRDGIPPNCATFVVIPCMLARRESAAVLLERLEIHFLSNPDPQLWFALLTDFSDAPNEHMPDDESFLADAAGRIKALNERHCGQGPTRFFLCHRRRQWNPSQNCWMGWERKRGKLLEFNRLLRGDQKTSFSAPTGDWASLPFIRYVITLDADTQLPRETARRLIAALAHPLNQPRVSRDEKRVTSGYAILQPRIGMSLAGAEKSWFAHLFSLSAGVDPYAVAISDVYQDLFGKGSFTGKGIYDIDAFELSVGKVFPDNHILSHDLIEGNYASCGLASDIELVDQFPPRYNTYALREHRWVRGDWQIMPWLFPHVPGPDGGSTRNPLPIVERWKILDNLRRSLLPPALLILLITSWSIAPATAWLTTSLAMLVYALPLAPGLLMSPITFLRIGRLDPNLPATAGQVLLSAAFLPKQAWIMLDAIVRTLWRLLITRRHLLDWETAASTERRLGNGVRQSWRDLWPAPALATVLAVGLPLTGSEVWLIASPFLIGWWLAPFLAYWVSRPMQKKTATISEEERRRLFSLARRTWSFFETYVGQEDNWLPPDNYQEDPKNQVAHRTSPTNIGLYLISTITAHDFGFISLPVLLERLEKSFVTLTRLERVHGHFLNWYDTQNLQSLQPRYISTVDSGNLLACLLTLKHALTEKTGSEVPVAAIIQGIRSTADQVVNSFRSLEPPHHPAGYNVLARLEELHAELERRLNEAPTENAGFSNWLERLELLSQDLVHEGQVVAGLIRETPSEFMAWSAALHTQIHDQVRELIERPRDVKLSGPLLERCQALVRQADSWASEMDFKTLYNEQRHLFSVGYNLSHGRLDPAHYDLLASEASLTSFLAVARGDVPQRHWFQLGRPVTRIRHGLALMSWGGTMFEYLMPRLFLRALPGTLLAETQQGAVERQIEYGQKCSTPWGTSESAFSTVDGDLNYQYQAFGVPGLGLKRGLNKDLVVAPYATFLAVGINPRPALANLDRLKKEGAEGWHGYYEAIDYTRDRLQPRQRCAIVKCYMAHHQGMSFLALANCLLDESVSKRLHAEPMVRATELLLQERVPVVITPQPTPRPESGPPPATVDSPVLMCRRLSTPNTAFPRTHMLSNGQYSVMVTNAGAGCSTCAGLDVTRWREDRARDNWGQFCYLRDERSGLLWSAGHQPICRPPDDYEVVYATDKAEFRRVDGMIETRLDIAITPEHRAEVRKLVVTNHDAREHIVELTSYVEIVLTAHATDLAHPAFGKLFLETEFIAADEALLCRRRPRASDQKPIWAVHVLAHDGFALPSLQYETDRARFLGRGRTTANPIAVEVGAVLSATSGPVLDPIFSLRKKVRIAPHGSASIAFTTAVADTREEALALADQYHEYQAVTRVFELAWAHSQVELQHNHLSAEDAHLFQRLAAHVFFAGPRLRAAAAVLAANHQGQPGLWRHGISGDRPIVLVRIGKSAEIALVRQLIAAHIFWRQKGLEVDLVVLNEHEGGYFEDLQEELRNLVRAGEDRNRLDQPAGVFIRKATHIPKEDLTLLQAAARCILVGVRGTLADQLERLERFQTAKDTVDSRAEQPFKIGEDGTRPIEAPVQAIFHNGLGGFSADGREYVLLLKYGKNPQKDAQANGTGKKQAQPDLANASHLPPAPWANVIANSNFGFLISESGSACTWAGNSQTNRLTPWSNDPVSDVPGEAIYLRDEKSGEIWSPTFLPMAGAAPTLVRHGQGYSSFEQNSHGIRHELIQFVPVNDPIKLVRLKLKNLGRRARRISVTFYAEWVLGTVREQAAMHVTTSVDAISGAILVRNPFNANFGDRVAFADTSLRPRSFTTDRDEFLGRNGSLAAPRGLKENQFSNTTGAGLDPCLAIQGQIELIPGEEKEIVFYLGQARSLDELSILKRYRETVAVDRALNEVKKFWDSLLSTVQVTTPNPGMDLLLNRWLLYQVLSCRLWGRTAFYQSSGAFGFRDQLQDVMALVYAAPELAKEHILRAANRQFLEGDVQHWWHEPDGAGVRTRCCDDFLWLPFVVLHYVTTTGDKAILDEQVPFLEAPALRPEQDEDYRVPAVSRETATLYEHCARAVQHGCRFGSHGLPLMGTGDWNDGMNWVGHEGKGESVWAGWFLLTILRKFALWTTERAEPQREKLFAESIASLQRALQEHGWDGAWYRRAYFDNGTPLGSAHNDECRIDSLPQSWAVISGAGDPQRNQQAMDAAAKRLVGAADKLIKLFTPPFDKGAMEPGYVKGYVPGTRENGGQYTHGATWVIQAFALLGQGTKAVKLFDWLNPICHASTPEQVARYRIEPYVVAGDVYGEPPLNGRGGWSWYTGAAAWLYRVALETILGFQLEGTRLKLDPCIPGAWSHFEIAYRHKSARYRIRFENPNGVEKGIQSVDLDGKRQDGNVVELVDDGKDHEIHVVLGR
jgi:cyclic beta-1,2-glucan synthetase